MSNSKCRQLLCIRAGNIFMILFSSFRLTQVRTLEDPVTSPTFRNHGPSQYNYHHSNGKRSFKGMY